MAIMAEFIAILPPPQPLPIVSLVKIWAVEFVATNPRQPLPIAPLPKI